MPDVANLNIKFTTTGADQAVGAMNRLGGAVDSTATKSKGFVSNMLSTAAGVAIAGGVGLITSAVVGFGKSALTAGLDFDQGMANISAVTGATGTELKSLSDLALKIGTDSQFGANDAALAIEQLALAGVSTQDILNGAAQGATALAAAGGVALPEAATVMSAALNQFGLGGDQAMHVADLLAGASAASATGVSELGESLNYVGTTAHSLNMPIEDVTTALAVMANQGMVGSMAGTALNQALLSMANPTAKAQTAMDELGISFTDINGNMKPLPQVISEVATATAGLTDKKRAEYLENIFGVEGGRAMNAMLASQTEEAKKAGKSWEDMYKAVTKNGVATEQAAARMNSARGDIEQLKGTLETIGIMATMTFLPMMRGAIQGVTRGLSVVPAWIGHFQRLRDKGLGIMPAAFEALRDAFSDTFSPGTAAMLNGWVTKAENGFNTLVSVGKTVGGAIKDVAGVFTGFMNQGLNPVAAAAATVAVGFQKLSEQFPAFRGFFEGMRDQMTNWMGAAQAVGKGIGQLFNGDVKGALQSFGEAAGLVWDNVLNGARTLWTGLKEAAALVDWGAVGNAMMSGLQAALSWLAGIGSDIWNWLSDAVAGIDWGAVWSTVQDATGWIIDKLGDLGSKLMTWVADAAGRIDWGSVASTARDIAGDVLGKLGDLGSRLMSWVADAAGRIDWGAVASTARDIAGEVIGKLGDLGSRLMTWVVDAAGRIDWASIASGARDIAGEVVSRIGDLGSRLMTWVVEAASRVDWGSIASNARDIASDVVSKLGDLGSALKTWIGKGISGMDLGGIGASIGAKLASIDYAEAGRNVGGKIVSALGSALSKVSWHDVGFAIGKGLQALIGGDLALTQFAGGLIGELAKALTKADTWKAVGSAIKDAFNGFWKGITDGLQPQLNAAEDAVLGFVNKVIGYINKVIAGLNAIGANIKPIDFVLNPRIIVSQVLAQAKSAAEGAAKTAKAAMDNILNPNRNSGGSQSPDASGGTPSGGVGAFDPGKGGIGMPLTSRRVTTIFDAQDNTSAIAARVTAGIQQVPADKLSQLRQMGGEAVSAVAGAVRGAISVIQNDHLTAIRQNGGEGVTGIAGVVRGAIGAIQPSHLTAIMQAGGEYVTSVSYGARNAIASIASSHFTSIVQSGAESVANAAYNAAAAVNGIPSFKSVTVSIVVSGLNAAQNALAAVGAKAEGGYVTTATTWLAEKGRELVRFPGGDWFMAQAKALYSVPKGSFVYTNAETERMVGSLAPVQGYAGGGVVGGGTSPGYSPAPMIASAPTINHFHYMVITRQDVDDIFNTVDAMKVLTNPDALRAVMGGPG